MARRLVAAAVPCCRSTAKSEAHAPPPTTPSVMSKTLGDRRRLLLFPFFLSLPFFSFPTESGGFEALPIQPRWGRGLICKLTYERGGVFAIRSLKQSNRLKEGPPTASFTQNTLHTNKITSVVPPKLTWLCTPKHTEAHVQNTEEIVRGDCRCARRTS